MATSLVLPTLVLAEPPPDAAMLEFMAEWLEEEVADDDGFIDPFELPEPLPEEPDEHQ